MKRVFTIIIIFWAGLSFAQNYNWITPNKSYLKLYVSEDGMYRINKVDFTNSGINANSIDPRTVKLYFRGNQIPVYFFGEQDGVFNENDYFDFYGIRNYGGNTIHYKEANGTFVPDYITDEYFNLFSDTSVYWVGWDGSFGLRYTESNYNTSIYYSQNFYYPNLRFEKDLVYSLGEHRSPDDYRYFNNEIIDGEGWFWSEMQRGNSVSDTFSTPQLSPVPQNCFLKVSAYPNSFSDSIFNEHRLIIRINGNIFDTLESNDYNRTDTTIIFSSSLLSNTTVNQISVTYTGAGTYVGRMFFNYFSLQYPGSFIFQNNSISFKTNVADSTSKIFKIKGFNPSADLNIYDVKNYIRITSNAVSSDTLLFTGKGNGNFEIANKYITHKPFRIKQKQVPNLASGSNGTDYLVVYNKQFESQAEQLRQYRNSHDGFRSVKVEIEDIYDIFNFGIENPVAVRNFVQFVYNNWQLPKVKYLMLFGRGSLDPKKNLTGSQYYQNYIPVYGNPPTDGYFANITPSSFTYNQQISTGRLPAYTVQEAQDMVNKIIGYEQQSTQLESWVKQFIFITGGQNRQEQIQFANQSDVFINSYIYPPPISGYAVKIYRNDSSGYVTYNYQDSIKKAINRGSLITNYIGHAASSTWDNGLDDPNVLTNQSRLPLVLSMTCFTGKNAETNMRSFGENFMFLPNKGALGFIGTTGWSFSGSGNTFNEYLLQGFARDSLRRIGDIIRQASNKMAPDSSNFASRNTINCYNLMGDPASKLLMPVFPEFDIQENDYALSNPFPSIRESITLKTFPKNLGTYADSCKIRYQLLKNNISYKTKDTVLHNFRFIDTVNYTFVIDSAGNYVMKVILDPENWYPQELKTNNSISIPIVLKNISFVPLKPIDNQSLPNDTVVFVGINPNMDPNKNNIKLLLQIDTTKNFNSPICQTYFTTSVSGVVSKFKTRMPIIDSNIVYFWRMNAVINNTDTTGWSEVRRYVFAVNSAAKVNIVNDSNITINKKTNSQYNFDEINNLMFDGDNIKLKRFVSEIQVQSGTYFSYNGSFIRIQNTEIQLTGIENSGLYIFKVKKINGAIVSQKNFKITSTQSSDSVVNYLNSFDTTHLALFCKVFNTVGATTLSSTAQNKIKEFGSQYIDSVGTFSWYSTWSMIGYIGASSQNIAEKFIFYPGGGSDPVPALSVLNREFMYLNGSLTNMVGPSKLWKIFTWNQFLYPLTNISFDVFGINNNNSEILIGRDLTSSNNAINLDTINAINYSYLKIITKLSSDSVNGQYSPVFKNFKLNYFPPPELIADNNSFVKSDSSLQEGDTLRIKVKYWNVGFTSADGIVNTWSVSSPSGIRKIKSDTLNIVLFKDSSLFSDVVINTSGLRRQQIPKDTITVFFETRLKNNQNEFYTYNNTAITRFVVTGDSLKPVLDITYDGVKVLSGDYIQSKPQIILKFLDDSKIVIKDTSNIRVKLDNIYVPYYINGVKNPIIDLRFAEKSLQATLIFTPTLADGEHRFDYIAFDNSGNYADTVSNLLNVSPDLRILELTNYPNPMKSETHFIINLSGNIPPSSTKLKIFTVAGRTIKTIETPLNIGYNQIFWDGRDDDGDYVANGVYLYKLIIEGNSKKETAAQKLVVLK